MSANRAFRGRVSFGVIIGIIGIALAVAPLPRAVAAGSTTVDCSSQSVQAALDDPSEYSTINILGGTCSEVLVIDRDVTLAGAGARLTTLNGGGAGSVVTIRDGAVVTIRDLAIRDGRNVSGGGIHSTGSTVTLHRIVVTGNEATDFAGGGVYSSGGSLTVEQSTIEGNSADYPGGEVPVGGGGIAHFGPGRLSITGSTISSNAALGFEQSGGGLYNGGLATVSNSTISLNQAAYRGGGIINVGVLDITASTITGNEAVFGDISGRFPATGGGIENVGNMGSAVTLDRTILAANLAEEGPDCHIIGLGLPFTSGGFNLLGSSDECGPDSWTGDVPPLAPDPRLGPLAFNGGDTATHALLQGSPAINAIPAGDCLVATDQRGVARPQGTGCDIGSYEAQPATARDDAYETAGLTLDVDAPGVLANDTDPEGDSLTAVLVSPPSHGTLDLRPDGSFTYVVSGPGLDTFSYQARDATGLSNAATVTVNVLAPPTPPPKPHVPPDGVGVVDPATGEWHLAVRPTAPGAGIAGVAARFFFGNPGDTPFMGDWDCDGVDTPGQYRGSDGFVYLRNSNTSGIADISFFFGNPNDRPLPGDFNGDGCDTVSVHRPGEGRVYIINRLGSSGGSLGAADFSYYFGDHSDELFTGDFDGDGVDTVGAFRSGRVFLSNEHVTGISNDPYDLGEPDDQPLAGNWFLNSRKQDTVSVYRASDATFHLRYSNSAGAADSVFVFGEPGWHAISGHFPT